MIARHSSLTVDALPPLPLAEWRPTKETLHRYAQVVGKVRLEHTPYQNHWWHAPLHVTPVGLRAPHMVGGDRSFEIALDLAAHEATVVASTGDRAAFALRDGLSVAEFYRSLLAALGDIGVPVELANPRPFDLGDDRPFAEDAEHAAYDAAAVGRYRRILVWVDHVFRAYGGRFSGKTSPVHLFWHGFDLAVTRFSGRAVPVPPEATLLNREGYSHEVISFGFWPGDANVPDPAFYAYAAPAPAGLDGHPLRPPAAAWQPGGMAVLMYEEVRTSPTPEETLLEFMESVYQAGAAAANWDAAALRIEPARWRVAETGAAR
jgi:hypothetical protein